MKKSWVCLIVVLLMLSCAKTEEARIPYREVYLELDLTFEDKDLLNVNNSKIFTSRRNAADRIGFGGVIVYHSPYDSGYGSYVAYDLACPYEAEASTKLSIDPESAGVYVICPKCQSRYELATGFAESSSISTYRLQQYMIQQSGSKLIVHH